MIKNNNVFSLIKDAKDSRDIVQLFECENHLRKVVANIQELKSFGKISQKDIDSCILELVEKYSKINNIKYEYNGNYLEVIADIQDDLDNRILNIIMEKLVEKSIKINWVIYYKCLKQIK